MELPYAAGLFDGEGSVGITRPSPKSNRYRLIVQIAMTHRPTVEAVASAFGGRIQVLDAARYNPRASTRFDWRLSDTAAADFLRSIQPWLITKADAAVIALEFAQTIQRPRGGRRLAPEILAHREELRRRLSDANQRRG